MVQQRVRERAEGSAGAAASATDVSRTEHSLGFFVGISSNTWSSLHIGNFLASGVNDEFHENLSVKLVCRGDEIERGEEWIELTELNRRNNCGEFLPPSLFQSRLADGFTRPSVLQ